MNNAGFMTHVTCRLTAKNRDQLRNPTLGNRVWATVTFFKKNNSSAINGEAADDNALYRQASDSCARRRGYYRHSGLVYDDRRQILVPIGR